MKYLTLASLITSVKIRPLPTQSAGCIIEEDTEGVLSGEGIGSYRLINEDTVAEAEMSEKSINAYTEKIRERYWRMIGREAQGPLLDEYTLEQRFTLHLASIWFFKDFLLRVRHDG